MIDRSNSGIVYPEDIKIEKRTSGKTVKLPHVQKVPYKALRLCQSELEDIFADIGNAKVKNIFAVGVLKQGKLDFDDPFLIYTNEDCPLQHPLLVKDDEICSEEYCAEILLPFCDTYFPGIEVVQFLTNEKSDRLAEFIEFLKKDYPFSLIFISEL